MLARGSQMKKLQIEKHLHKFLKKKKDL